MENLDPSYQPPAWLQSQLGAIGASGDYGVGDPVERGRIYAQGTDVVVAKFFDLYLNNPDEAIKQVHDYISKFREVNTSAGILNSATQEQQGTLINIIALRYSEADVAHRESILRECEGCLSVMNVRDIPHFTAQLRNPDLLRDLVANWDVNMPNTNGYIEFAESSSWRDVDAALQDPDNNPLLLAIAIPLDSTATKTRERFAEDHPDLSEQGIRIIGAYLRTLGAHHDMLSGEMPQYYQSWEDTINYALLQFGEEHRSRIVDEVVGGSDSVLYMRNLSFKDLYEMLATAEFTAGSDGDHIENVTWSAQ